MAFNEGGEKHFSLSTSRQVKVIELMQNFPTIAIWNWLDEVHRQFSFIDFITPIWQRLTGNWSQDGLGKHTHTLIYNIKTNSADTQDLICGPYVDFRW